MKGRKFSKEHKKNIGAALQGKRKSEEHKRKNSEAHVGKKTSKETKLKLSNLNSGKYDPKARRVICIELDKIFDTRKDAAQWAGVAPSTIRY